METDTGAGRNVEDCDGSAGTRDSRVQPRAHNKIKIGEYRKLIADKLFFTSISLEGLLGAHPNLYGGC